MANENSDSFLLGELPPVQGLRNRLDSSIRDGYIERLPYRTGEHEHTGRSETSIS